MNFGGPELHSSRMRISRVPESKPCFFHLATGYTGKRPIGQPKSTNEVFFREPYAVILVNGD
jgi:hypothetical protein